MANTESTFPTQQTNSIIRDSENFLMSRIGSPFVDIEGAPVLENRYTEAVLTIANAINAKAETLTIHEEVSSPNPPSETTRHHKDSSDFSLLSAGDKLHILESTSIKHVLLLAEKIKKSDDASETIDIAAKKIAKSKLEIKRLIEYVSQAFTEHSAIIGQNKKIIEEAWRRSAGNLEEAISIAIEEIMKKPGHLRPQIIVWNDIDQNLTQGEHHNDSVPVTGNIRKAYQKHGRPTIEYVAFASVYDATLSHHHGRDMFRAVGQNIQNVNILPGVKETFSFAEQNNIDMRLLTTNFFLVAEGLGLSLGVSQKDIYGRSSDQHISTIKPYVIMKDIISNPNSIHIIVDDGDTSLVRSILERDFPDGSGIQDHAFIISRKNTDSQHQYAVEDALCKTGDPHGSHGNEYFSVLKVLKRASQSLNR